MPRRKKTPSDKAPTQELIPAIRAAIRVADRAIARVKGKRAPAKRPKR